MMEGTPNHVNQPATNVLATLPAVISEIRKASSKQAKWSTLMSKYVKPFESDNVPTISRWKWSNQASCVAKVENGVIHVSLYLPLLAL